MKEETHAFLNDTATTEIYTVIHHPEDDLPLLAGWLRYVTEDRGRFFAFLGVVVAFVVGLTFLSSGISVRSTTTDEAWVELQTAKTGAEREKVAEKFPNTPAGQWALLQAATDFYNKGFSDLPANRDVALPDLKKALGLFEKVIEKAPKDSAQARAAMYGKAQTLEARNEIDKAIAQYDLVAKEYAGTNEAKQATRQAELLRKPGSVSFYKELYAYKATETVLPPLGEGNLNLPLGGPSPLDGVNPLGGPNPLGSQLMFPPPPPTPPTGGKPEAPANAELPVNPFVPPPPPASTPAPAPAEPAAKPAAEMPAPAPTSAPAPTEPAPKAETPAPAPAPTPAPTEPAPKAETPKESPAAKPELPSDVFAPKDAPSPAPAPAPDAKEKAEKP